MQITYLREQLLLSAWFSPISKNCADNVFLNVDISTFCSIDFPIQRCYCEDKKEGYGRWGNYLIIHIEVSLA